MDNKSARIKSEFDKIIKEEIGHVLEENDCTEILSDDDMRRLGVQLPPEDMHDRIMQACKDNKPIRRHNIKRILVIAAIIAALAGGTGAMAYKFFDTNLFTQMRKRSVRIIEEGEEAEVFKITEKEVYSKVEEKLGIELLRPKYIPNGFFVDVIRTVDCESAKIIYIDAGDGKIEFTQKIKFENSSTSDLVDTISGNAETEEIGNFEVMFVEYMRGKTNIKWINAYWTDDNLKYTISTNIQKSEIKKIIENME